MSLVSVAIAAETGDKSAGSAAYGDVGWTLAGPGVAPASGAACPGCASGVTGDLIAVSRAIAPETAIKSAESAATSRCGASASWPGDVTGAGAACVGDGGSAAGEPAVSAEAAALVSGRAGQAGRAGAGHCFSGLAGGTAADGNGRGCGPVCATSIGGTPFPLPRTRCGAGAVPAAPGAAPSSRTAASGAAMLALRTAAAGAA